MLKLKGVSKFYYNKGVVATGFTKVNLELNIGEFVVITGESGSGKSTLLNVISGLDTYEEGEMYINGEETSYYGEADFETYRKKYIGNIFQNFNLINSYTVYQNLELVLLLNGYNSKDIKDKIIDILIITKGLELPTEYDIYFVGNLFLKYIIKIRRTTNEKVFSGIQRVCLKGQCARYGNRCHHWWCFLGTCYSSYRMLY